MFCYCREKPLFSFPSVFGSQIQVFISSDIAQQKHYIRPHKTLQSDSAQSPRERVLLEDSLRLIQMGIHDYFLVLVRVWVSWAPRRVVKWNSGFSESCTSSQRPSRCKTRRWSRKTRNWSALTRRSWTPVKQRLEVCSLQFLLIFIQWRFCSSCFSALLLYFFYWIDLRNICPLFK